MVVRIDATYTGKRVSFGDDVCEGHSLGMILPAAGRNPPVHGRQDVKYRQESASIVRRLNRITTSMADSATKTREILLGGYHPSRVRFLHLRDTAMLSLSGRGAEGVWLLVDAGSMRLP